MYYRSVNRGVAFTKPGRYALLLIFGVGAIAVNTGANGMFLLLSLGLGLLIASGLLSERAMRQSRIQATLPIIADAETPFELALTMINASLAQTLYGIEAQVLREAPRSRWLSLRFTPIGSGSLVSLSPNSSRTCLCSCLGTPRGRYSELYIVVRTSFPFGLIEKFKIVRARANLVVLPAFKPELAAILRREGRSHLWAFQAEHDFYAHRAYTGRDPVRHIDWRKSAGRDHRQWVVKQFKATSDDVAIDVAGSWVEARAVSDEDAYESYLADLRTALQVAFECASHASLSLDGQTVATSLEEGQAYLAALPRHAGRDTHLPPALAQLRLGSPRLLLQVTTSGARWMASRGGGA